MAVQPMRVGVLGAGMISDAYLRTLRRAPAIDLAAIADLRQEAAAAAAERFGIDATTADDLIADPAIELIVNLTPIVAHAQTTMAALHAGKHVYSEKVLATSYPEAVQLRLEAERRGLGLACAPDTPLGTGFSAARRALAAGVIGAPVSATAIMLRESVTEPGWYTDESMPFLDMGPYYLTALIDLFGPARTVAALGRSGTRDQLPPAQEYGSPIELTGVIDFHSGASATVQLGWGSSYDDEVTRLDVFGRTGVINFANPNNFGDPAYVGRYGDPATEIEGSRQPQDWDHNLRGIGVAEFATALRERQLPRARADVACHVVELLNALFASSRHGHQVPITSTCEVPESITDEDRRSLLGV